MTDGDHHNARSIPTGTPVRSANGRALGRVREAYAHYLLVEQEGEHEDLNVPVHSILRVEDGDVCASVTQESASPVDHEETVHRRAEDV
jgi:hypothetical protein